MSRKREERPPARDESFKNSSLRDALGKWKQETTPKEPPRPPAPKPAPPPPPSRSAKGGARSEAADAALFRAAMEDVQPIARAAGAKHLPPAPAPTIAEINEDAEALAQLAELVATGEGIDLADTDEYIEGGARGVDPTLVQRLRAGDFSVQAHVDLHGLSADAAKQELERFLTESRRHGHRCVLVVHGRGMHSKDQIPVIKSRMTSWLSRGRLGRMVLAFATARPVDGGAGALYVLLRR